MTSVNVSMWNDFVDSNQTVIQWILLPFCTDLSVFRFIRVNKLCHKIINIFDYQIRREYSLMVVSAVNRRGLNEMGNNNNENKAKNVYS